MSLSIASLLTAASGVPTVQWTQTAFTPKSMPNLFKEQKPLKLTPAKPPGKKDKALAIDCSQTYQTLLGFGGAFTEASALNLPTVEAMSKLLYGPWKVFGDCRNESDWKEPANAPRSWDSEV